MVCIGTHFLPFCDISMVRTQAGRYISWPVNAQAGKAPRLVKLIVAQYTLFNVALNKYIAQQ